MQKKRNPEWRYHLKRTSGHFLESGNHDLDHELSRHQADTLVGVSAPRIGYSSITTEIISITTKVVA